MHQLSHKIICTQLFVIFNSLLVKAPPTGTCSKLKMEITEQVNAGCAREITEQVNAGCAREIAEQVNAGCARTIP